MNLHHAILHYYQQQLQAEEVVAREVAAIQTQIVVDVIVTYVAWKMEVQGLEWECFLVISDNSNVHEKSNDFLF